MPTAAQVTMALEMTGIEKFHGEVEKINKLMAKGATAAAEEFLGKKALKKASDLVSDLKKGAIEIAQIENKLKEEGLDKLKKKELRSTLDNLKKEFKVRHDAVEQELKVMEKHSEIRKAAAKEATQVMEASALRVDTMLESAFERFKGADIAGAITGGAERARGVGAGVAGKGREIQKMEGATKAMKGLGVAMRGIGVALAPLGIIAGLLGVLVKVFMGLDKVVKDFNKDLLEGVTIGDMGFNRMSDAAMELEGRLQTVRDAAFKTENNLRWMTMPEDQMRILKAFNEAGFRLRDMTRDIKSAHDEMRRYNEVTASALTYSKLLGVEATKMATDMGTIMADTGLQLSQVQEGFSKVARIAQESGFNTKRFYTTILEATTGTGYYNIRIEEAASLLKTFSDILGKKPGEEFFKGMEAGFAEMSYKERFKQIMVTGGKATRQILDAEAKKAADRFSDTLTKDKRIGSALESVGKNLGISVDATGGRNLAQSLAKMTEKDFAKFTAQLRIQGTLNAEQRKELTRIRELQKGAGGRLGEQAKALDDMSRTGTLAMQMTSFMGKSLHEYSAIQLAAFEDFKGTSGKQLENLIRLSRDFHGSWELLQDAKKDRSKQFKNNQVLTKQQAELLKKQGFAVDEQGRVRKVQVDSDNKLKFVGDEITNVREFIVNQNKLTEAATQLEKEQFTKDQQIAQEIVRNTEPLSKILDIAIQGWLMKIHDILKPLGSVIMKALSYLPGVGDDVKKFIAGEEMKQATIEREGKHLADVKDSLAKMTEQEKKLTEFEQEKKAQGISLPPELAERLADLRTYIEGAQVEEKRTEARIKAARGRTGEEFTTGAAAGTIAAAGVAVEGKSAVPKKKFEEIASGTNEMVNSIDDWIKKVDEKRAEEKAEAKAMADEQKKRDDEIKKAADELGPKNIVTGFAAELKQFSMDQKKERLASFMTAIGATGAQARKAERLLKSPASLEKYLGRVTSGKWKGLTPEQKAAALRSAPVFLPGMQMEAEEVVGGTAPVTPTDFILTDSGRLIRPAEDDTIMGMRPGGPLARAMGGAPGARAEINVTIVESHNTEKTYATVKRALRDGGLI